MPRRGGHRRAVHADDACFGSVVRVTAGKAAGLLPAEERAGEPGVQAAASNISAAAQRKTTVRPIG